MSHRRVRSRISLAALAVVLVGGALFASPVAGGATSPAPLAIPVGHPDAHTFPKTVISSCASSDASIAHCSVIPNVTSTARILCLRTGPVVITLFKKTKPELAQPVQCVAQSNTRNFTALGPLAFDVPIKSCTTTNPLILCILPARNPSRPNKVTLLCRHLTNAPATFTVKLLDATFTYPTVCDQPNPSSFTVKVGTSRGTTVPSHKHQGTWWKGQSAMGCRTADHAIGHCWQNSPQGLLLRCDSLGTVVLTLEGVRGGDMEVLLHCVS